MYDRALPALPPVAGDTEGVLGARGGVEMDRGWQGGARVVEVVEFDEQKVEEYSHGSRAEGPSPGIMVTAAATRSKGLLYLG